MLFDRDSYEQTIRFIKENISELFKGKMKIESGSMVWNRMNYFQLKYVYEPFDYIIDIENERRLFTISIIDSEGAENTLQRIERFDNSLSEENIKNALVILKRTLTENNFDLYIYKDDKVYIKNKQGIKRVKRI